VKLCVTKLNLSAEEVRNAFKILIEGKEITCTSLCKRYI
jgi:hypothetical protein